MHITIHKRSFTRLYGVHVCPTRTENINIKRLGTENTIDFDGKIRIDRATFLIRCPWPWFIFKSPLKCHTFRKNFGLKYTTLYHFFVDVLRFIRIVCMRVSFKTWYDSTCLRKIGRNLITRLSIYFVQYWKLLLE